MDKPSSKTCFTIIWWSWCNSYMRWYIVWKLTKRIVKRGKFLCNLACKAMASQDALAHCKPFYTGCSNLMVVIGFFSGSNDWNFSPTVLGICRDTRCNGLCNLSGILAMRVSLQAACPRITVTTPILKTSGMGQFCISVKKLIEEQACSDFRCYWN